jgi:1-acyl-sn-glycerol-3-phosphate acyltransferase
VAVRAWSRIAALIGLILLCLLPHLLSRLIGRDSRWPRRFQAGAARLCGLKVEVAGQPLRQDVFFVANHISWLDILVLGGATGCAFVSRDDVAGWPVVGWMARQNRTIFVSRTERGAVQGQVDGLRAALEHHQPVTLFPEGTTSDGHGLLPFKAALFQVLLPPPRAIRVQPVLIDYGPALDDIAWVGEEPFGANAMRVLGRRGRTRVTLRFLDPFDPGAQPDRKAISAEVRSRIEAAMQAFREGPRPV